MPCHPGSGSSRRRQDKGSAALLAFPYRPPTCFCWFQPLQVASFVRERLYDGGSRRLRRAFTRSASAVDAFSDDYALMVRGLLDLHAVTGDVSHLQASALRAGVRRPCSGSQCSWAAGGSSPRVSRPCCMQRPGGAGACALPAWSCSQALQGHHTPGPRRTHASPQLLLPVFVRSGRWICKAPWTTSSGTKRAAATSTPRRATPPSFCA